MEGLKVIPGPTGPRSSGYCKKEFGLVCFYLPGLLVSMDQLLQLCNPVPPHQHGLGHLPVLFLLLPENSAQVGAVLQEVGHHGAADILLWDPAGPPGHTAAREAAREQQSCPALVTHIPVGC